jgi:deoxyribose-phosphate aldolase
MTEKELQDLADAIVAKVRDKSPSRHDQSPGRQVAKSPGAAPGPISRGNLALKHDPSGKADIAWRGPNVQTAAWTPSAGARRVADFVDHTILKAETTKAEVEKICAEAKQHTFAAVCVNGTWVEMCVDRLKGTGVAVAAVVGFPLGAMTMRSKAAEAREAVASGASEIDMVIQLGRLKSGLWGCVEDDIRSVVEASKPGIVKVIIESSALTREEIVKCSALAKEAGAHFVKTSTGFHASGGASLEAVRLMRIVVGDALGVKASGGIRDCETALAMIAAGANRLGTSSGVAFVTCLGPGPLPLAELLKQPHAHASKCSSGNCQPAGGAQPY